MDLHFKYGAEDPRVGALSFVLVLVNPVQAPSPVRITKRRVNESHERRRGGAKLAIKNTRAQEHGRSKTQVKQGTLSGGAEQRGGLLL